MPVWALESLSHACFTSGLQSFVWPSLSFLGKLSQCLRFCNVTLGRGGDGVKTISQQSLSGRVSV